MRRMIMGILCLMMLLAPITGMTGEADGGTDATGIQLTEWNWTPGNLSQFEGTIRLPENCPDPAKIKLTIVPTPATEDNGPIVFTHIEGKRLTVKKQSDEYTIHPTKLNGAVHFKGSWTIPEDGYYNSAVITVSLMNEAGEKLEEHSFTFANGQTGAAENGEGLINLRTDRIVLWLAIAAGVIWLAAAGRILLNWRQKRRAES